MQSLSDEQIEQVNGGAFPVLIAVAAAAYSFAAHAAVRSIGSYVLSRAATAYAVYSAAEVAGSSNRSGSGSGGGTDINNVGDKDLKKTD